LSLRGKRVSWSSMLAYEALKPTSLHNKSRGFERQCQRCEFNPRRKNANGVETDKWSISVITPLFGSWNTESSRGLRRLFHITIGGEFSSNHPIRTRQHVGWNPDDFRFWISDFRLTDHLITRSALAKTLGGMVNPICLAAVKFAVKINLVGYSTGNSPGFAPFKILSTNLAARRYDSLRSAP